MKFLKLIFIPTLVLILSGCASIRKGETRNLDCRVLGVDLSVPIVGMANQNIINLRFGWIETRYSHTYQSKVTSNVTQDVHFFTGEGTIHRFFEISSEVK